MVGWTTKEYQWLWFHACDEPVAFLAEKLGRSEQAVRKRMHRLGIRRGASELQSLAEVAKHIGVHPRVVKRVGKELGQRWVSNRKEGATVRFYLSEQQVVAIVERLKQTWTGEKHPQLGRGESMAVRDANHFL